jgi:flagellin-like hook-associated protein FlgL
MSMARMSLSVRWSVGGARDTTIASQIKDAATVLRQGTTDVNIIRGRFGAFQRELASSLQVKSRTFEAVVASRSQIRDTNYAVASSQLLRAQILERASFFAAFAVNSQFGSTLDLLSVVGRSRDLTPDRTTQDSLGSC